MSLSSETMAYAAPSALTGLTYTFLLLVPLGHVRLPDEHTRPIHTTVSVGTLRVVFSCGAELLQGVEPAPQGR